MAGDLNLPKAELIPRFHYRDAKHPIREPTLGGITTDRSEPLVFAARS